MTEHELLVQLDALPPIMTRWRHYKGGRYLLTARVLREADLVPLIVYCRLLTGLVEFVRPASEWQELVPFEGQMVPRFTPLENDHG